MAYSGMDRLPRDFPLDEVKDERQNLFGGGHVAANPAVELDGPAAFHREANVIDELTGAHLDHRECRGAARELPDLRRGKRIERDGPEQADTNSRGSRRLHHRLENTAFNSVAAYG